MPDNMIAAQLNNPDKYTFFVPLEARWDPMAQDGVNLSILKSWLMERLRESAWEWRTVRLNVGTYLNKALEALEDANVDTLQDVLKGINFNRKIGQRTLDDDTLSNFIQNFEKIHCAMRTSSSPTCSAPPMNT